MIDKLLLAIGQDTKPSVISSQNTVENRIAILLKNRNHGYFEFISMAVRLALGLPLGLPIRSKFRENIKGFNASGVSEDTAIGIDPAALVIGVIIDFSLGEMSPSMSYFRYRLYLIK